MISTLRLYYHSVIHTPPSRLLARLAARVKARLNAFAPGLSRRALRAGIGGGDGASTALQHLPEPLHPIRAGNAFHRAGKLHVHLLGEAREVPLPLDWRAEFDAGDPELWEMNLHYMSYIHRLTDRLFVELLDSWIRSVHPYERARDLAWVSFTVSTRVTVWMQELSRRGHRLDPEFLARVADSLFEQLRFLRKNLEMDVRGNHLVRNIRALHWGARAFEGEEPSEWEETAWRLLIEELEEQILPDGGHFERSPAYHAQVLADLLEIRHLTSRPHRRAILLSKLRPMIDAMAGMVDSRGRRALINDGGRETGPSWKRILATWKSAGGEDPTASGCISLPETGFFGIRTDDVYLIIKAGAIGSDHLPAHAHGDIFSYELTLRGQPVIVDSGTYRYAEGEMRVYSRSTVAHNTVSVDRVDQAEFWRQFRVGRRYPPEQVQVDFHEKSMSLRGVFPGYRELIGDGILHRRSMRWQDAEARLTVEDEVSGRGRHLVESRVHVHPDVTVEQVRDRILLRWDGGLASVRVRNGRLRVDSSWYCPAMGQRRRRASIVVFHHGELPATLRYEVTIET